MRVVSLARRRAHAPWEELELKENTSKGIGPVPSRLDVDATTFRLVDGQLRLNDSTESVTLYSLVMLQRMIDAAIRRKRQEMKR